MLGSLAVMKTPLGLQPLENISRCLQGIMGSESHPGLGHHRCQCYPGMRRQLCREDGGEDSGEWLDSLEQSSCKLEERQELGLFSA